MRILRIALSLLSLFSVTIISFSSEPEWRAHWIMHPYVQPQQHALILFRKTFDLPSKPEKFVIHLSADNHYRLFVNGTYILRGPARGDLSHWFYETVDIAPYLKSGNNSLAAEVVNWGPKRSFTFFSQMTSFIMQGETDNEKAVNTSGGSWKCFHNQAVIAKNIEWMTDRSTIDFGLYVGNPTDSVRAELYPWGWETPGYDDSSWLQAKWCDISGGRGQQYAGDSRVHNLSLLTLSGDDRLTRNSLIQFDQSRIPEGLTYACYPNPFHLIIPSYSLIWIDQVHDYMMWKDDKEFVSGFELGITNLLDWFERRRQVNGLLDKIDWWGALAWPRHYKNGEPPDVYKGNNTLYTLHYAYSLRHAADIFRFTGKNEIAGVYSARADEICAAVNKLCRNADGYYTESIDNKQVSQVTNIMAILAEAIKGEDARKLMTNLLEPKDWFGQVDLFLHVYLFEAMNKTGLQEYFSQELSEWRLMKERGLTTFVEVPLEWGEENQRSECHPWSSSPNYYFFRTVCGIRPATPGHRKIEIAPSLGDLKGIYAIYPHYLGNIVIHLTKRGSGIKGEVTLPPDMEGEFVWNSIKINLKAGKPKISL